MGPFSTRGGLLNIAFLNYFPYKPIFDLSPKSAKTGGISMISTVNKFANLRLIKCN